MILCYALGVMIVKSVITLECLKSKLVMRKQTKLLKFNG